MIKYLCKNNRAQRRTDKAKSETAKTRAGTRKSALKLGEKATTTLISSSSCICLVIKNSSFNKLPETTNA